MEPAPERLKEMYRTMWRIRLFEEEANRQQAFGNVQGSFHMYIGEEAVAAGFCAHLRPDDYIVGTHRSHGHFIAKGGRVERMMAELFGREGGICRGKGGSMHVADFSVGMLGANGVVGGGFGPATGAALASQLRGDDRVTVCFFGDGAMQRGTFHEAINIGAIWNLPVIYVCENNQYQQWIPQRRMTKVTSVRDMAPSYGIPGESVDGQDVLAVSEVASRAIDRARTGGGPTLIECLTYRFHGHSPGDLQEYRDKEEVEYWRTERDPIQLLRTYLIERQQLGEDEDAAIRAAATVEIESAVAFAEASPFPPDEEIVTDVYVDAAAAS